MNTNHLKTEYFYNTVYYVEAADKKMILNPLAIKPKFFDNRVEWFDTSRGNAFQIKQLIISPDLKDRTFGKWPSKIEMVTDSGKRITLVLLDIRIYNEKIKSMLARSPEFNSDQDLEEYFLNTNFDLE